MKLQSARTAACPSFGSHSIRDLVNCLVRSLITLWFIWITLFIAIACSSSQFLVYFLFPTLQLSKLVQKLHNARRQFYIALIRLAELRVGPLQLTA
mmetsp:Transcript_6990/g.11212  ORF Transcript_6990/g.11212 Transcript_6990/m.11212 type:complete len:96 (-) Transcript_6990:381-668(-)